MKDEHASGYDFVKLSEGMAKALLAAAQEQVSQADQILEQTQSIADVIVTQIRAQAKQIEERNVRLKAFGEQMLDAHRKLNEAGDYSMQEQAAADRIDARTPASTPFAGAPVHVADRLRALDDLKRGRPVPAGTVASGPSNASGPRDPDANYPARASGLPGPVADIERFRVNRGEDREDRNDPATGPARS